MLRPVKTSSEQARPIGAVLAPQWDNEEHLRDETGGDGTFAVDILACPAFAEASAAKARLGRASASVGDDRSVRFQSRT